MASSSARSDHQAPRAAIMTREPGVVRQVAEAFVAMAMAVILFRAFVAEGYMISTGSMAPCLLGYHRQVVCPSCTFAFSRGTHIADPDSILAAGGHRGVSRPDIGLVKQGPATVCPNCGLSSIDVGAVPRNEGDQLMVHKHVYQLRPPKRWEVVVFRHPTDPAQAYVKRCVGLAGETIELIDGDVYADDLLQRKPLTTQQSMRIAVYDHDHEPRDDEWRPRWLPDCDDSGWAPYQSGFIHRRSTSHDASPSQVGDTTSQKRQTIDWLTYHHWVRSGGSQRSVAPLERWPDGVERADSLASHLSYDDESRRLEYRGVMSDDRADRLREATDDAQWRAAIDELRAVSHESPVVDVYGYNHPSAGDGPLIVHDLMVEAVVRRVQGEGEWRLRMTDGWHQFDTVFDFGDRIVRLHVDDKTEPVRSARIPVEAFKEATTVEVSLFDQEVLVALDGKSVLEPLHYAGEDRPRETTSRPVQLGAAGIDLQIAHLRLYRDVYYTPKHFADGAASADLGPDEFFMLGDNSPVSVDSRSWESPAIPRDLLIGKPFLVHLPSRQGRLEIAGKQHHIRIPDLSRIRYIR